MNRLKNIVYVLFLITTTVSAQTKRIQFVSDENQLPLSDVEVYGGALLIGKSDPNGYLDVKKTDSNYLRIIKEDYEEVEIKITDLHEKVILIKNKPIILTEVIVSKKANISVNKILNNINKTFDRKTFYVFSDLNKYKVPLYFIATNKLFMEKDTLHYLRGLMNYKENNEGLYRIEKNFHLVKNFRPVKVQRQHYDKLLTYTGFVYSINKKDIEFYDAPLWLYSIDTDHILTQNILKKRKKYNYIVTDIGDFYKIEFVCKSKSPFENSFLPHLDWKEIIGFNGYLVVDKKDFGIYEFKAHLSDNFENHIEKTKSASIINIEQKYLVTGIEYYIKYHKDKNGNYQLERCYYDEQFEQIQGNFKGKKFSYSSKVEATDNYKNVEFINFDLYRYELK